jgi:hypothetical protein
MNDLLIKIIFYLLLIVLLYQIIKPYTNESFINAPNVILIGNIFSDKDHTQHLSIKEELEKNRTSHLGEVVVLGEKCSSLADFKKNIKKLKRQNPELDQNSTHVFISVGFHDLLNNVHNCEEAIKVEPHSLTEKGVSKKLPCFTQTEIYNKWKTSVEYFSEIFPNPQITILSAYYLPEDKTIKSCGLKITSNRHLASDIDGWNADLAQFALEKDWGFIALDNEFSVKDITINTIDFTNNAKRKLVKLLQRKIH